MRASRAEVIVSLIVLGAAFVAGALCAIVGTAIAFSAGCLP
jgi:hypothetical protein